MSITVGGNHLKCFFSELNAIIVRNTDAKKSSEFVQNGRRRFGLAAGSLPEIAPKLVVDQVAHDGDSSESAAGIGFAGDLSGERIGFVFVGAGKDEGVGIEVWPEPLDVFCEQGAEGYFALDGGRSQPGKHLVPRAAEPVEPVTKAAMLLREVRQFVCDY